MKIEVSKIPKNRHCDYEGCENLATEIYWRQMMGFEMYCNKHLEDADDLVWIEDSSEYITHCPNCNCGFGVN